LIERELSKRLPLDLAAPPLDAYSLISLPPLLFSLKTG
jgi:hypothetical protein